jgi:hypothetical protein
LFLLSFVVPDLREIRYYVSFTSSGLRSQPLLFYTMGQ